MEIIGMNFANIFVSRFDNISEINCRGLLTYDRALEWIPNDKDLQHSVLQNCNVISFFILLPIFDINTVEYNPVQPIVLIQSMYYQ